MKKYMESPKELNVYGEFDVIVVGGGVAGLSAAISSARNGANTLIIERFPYFGGTATASLMANIVGFRNQVKPDGIQTTKGIGEEIILELIKMNGAVKSRNAYESEQRSDVKGDLSYNYAFDTEKFKYVTLKMVRDAGVKILFHTWFSDVIMDEEESAGRLPKGESAESDGEEPDGTDAEGEISGNRILKGIIIENKSGRQAVFAKVVIDGSGDGDVAFKAGVPYWQTKGEEAKRLNDGLMYKISGFNPDTRMGGCLIDDTMVVWGPTPGPTNAVNADELTEAEIRMRLAIYEDLEEKKRQNPDLGNARIIDSGSLIGIRQTRFFEGEYKLTGEDVLEGRVFPDSIAMAANPVIHYFGYRRFLEHEGYDIPYRCLVPLQVDNLLVVGRCMSSDQVAYESWRAMAHILAIGEAAGAAAAICAKEGKKPRSVDVAKLQEKLIEQGAEIGQSRVIRQD